MSASPAGVLGTPRVHFRSVDSTNLRARTLAAAGAPHGTLVTATEQSAGRGRQGRAWVAPPGTALLMSLVIRDPSRLLSLAAGAAVAETVEGAPTPTSDPCVSKNDTGVSVFRHATDRTAIKWPNDVLLDGRKIAGILVEGRPQDRWAVLGIGLNVAISPDDLPPELRDRAGTLGLPRTAVEPTLQNLLKALERWTTAADSEILEAVRARDALLGQTVTWAEGAATGTGTGIDDSGRLLVETAGGGVTALEAGEVHLGKLQLSGAGG